MPYDHDEMLSRLDEVLDSSGMQTGAFESYEPGFGETVDHELHAAIEVDRVIGPLTEHETEIARAAWDELTAESDLPGWFDELVTVGEMARRSGSTRAEVEAALDGAKRNHSLPLCDAFGASFSSMIDALATAGSTAEEVREAFLDMSRARPTEPAPRDDAIDALEYVVSHVQRVYATGDVMQAHTADQQERITERRQRMDLLMRRMACRLDITPEILGLNDDQRRRADSSDERASAVAAENAPLDPRYYNLVRAFCTRDQIEATMIPGHVSPRGPDPSC